MDTKRKRKAKTVDVPGLLYEEAGEGEQVDESCLACGQVHGQRRLVRMLRGERLSTYSETFRLFTEARWVLRHFKTKRSRQLYLAEVSNLRGPIAYQQLRDAMTKVYLGEQDVLPQMQREPDKSSR